MQLATNGCRPKESAAGTVKVISFLTYLNIDQRLRHRPPVHIHLTATSQGAGILIDVVQSTSTEDVWYLMLGNPARVPEELD